MTTPEPERVPLGRKLIDALALKDVNVHGEKLRMTGAHKSQWTTAFLEELERELAPFVGPLNERLLDNDDLPDALRALLIEGGTPEHQIGTIIEGFIVLATLPFTLGALAAPWIQKTLNTEWSLNPFVPLSPQEAAVAVNKGHLTFSEGWIRAVNSGMAESEFQTLVDATGNPPGIETLMAMLRRGIIDASRFVIGVEQSNLRLEWAGELEQLVQGPPSPQAAILGVVQNHLDEASARTIMKQNGLDPSYYPWLYANTGRPPGPMQMIDAWNRGATDQATVEQAIRESDIKDKYVPTIIALREHLLPQKTVVAGVHQGVITADEALPLLLKLGISPTNAHYLILEGQNRATAASHHLSTSQIETAYEDGSIDRPTAQARLTGLGYVAADATFMLDLVDVKWEQRLHAATISRVRALYLNGTLTRTQASADLDAAQVTPAHRDLYLKEWDLVRSTPTRHLTEAQAASAYRKGLIGVADFRARLVAMGFAPTDVDLVVQLNPVHITEAQAIAAYVAGTITEAQLRARLAEMGLATGEQDILIADHPRITPTGG